MPHTYVAVAPAYELEDLRDSEIPVAFVTVAPVYEFGGFRFEYHYMIGPSKLNKNGEESKRMGRKFLKALQQWCDLPEKEREKYRKKARGEE